jgi:hypothetical protein
LVGASLSSFQTRFPQRVLAKMHDATRLSPAHLAKGYTPECVEEEFCELRLYRILRSSELRISSGIVCSVSLAPGCLSAPLYAAPKFGDTPLVLAVVQLLLQQLSSLS